MSWLRLDDGFTQHPKLAGWTPAQKWAWLEVLSYCARYKTAGQIPDDLTLMPRSVTASLLARAERAGLIDRSENGAKLVHDWPIYNAGTIAEKVAYYLAKHPDSTANDVCKALGGTRELVLAEVKKQQDAGTKPGSESGSGTGTAEPGTSGSGRTSLAGSESGSRAREPVPSLKASTTSDRSEGTHAPGLNGITPLEKILRWAERDLDDGGAAIRKLARRQPEVVLARVAEGCRGKRVNNRAAYAAEALRREIAAHKEIRAQARQSLGLDNDAKPLPGEPV